MRRTLSGSWLRPKGGRGRPRSLTRAAKGDLAAAGQRVQHDLAGWLRHHRLQAGLSQEELAERAGVSVRAISDLERGARRLPHADTLQRLIQGLGLEKATAAALRRVAEAQEPARGGDH